MIYVLSTRVHVCLQLLFRHFNEAGSRLASGSDDLEIIVWDWQKAKKELSFKSGHTSNVFQSKFLPHSGDTLIATTSRDGQVRLAGKNLKIRTNIFLKYSIGMGI